MIKLLKAAIRNAESYIEASKDSVNPQVVEMRFKAEGRRDALLAVLDAARGDMMMLRILASGRIDA